MIYEYFVLFLQGLIPEVDPGSISMETTMEFEETGDLSNKDQKESNLENSTRSVIVMEAKENESTENCDTRAAKMRRTVYQVAHCSLLLKHKFECFALESTICMNYY